MIVKYIHVHVCLYASLIQALAILRQKPVGIAAREFTERLSLQFSQLQTNWKSKAEQLERELLKTRQDLIKCQLNSDVSKSDSLFQQHMHPRLPENAGADFNLNPSNSLPASEINPFHSQQQVRSQSRFPLSQIQVDSMYNYNTQLFESSSSQEIFSDGEWQSSGYSSSIPAQKENKSKLLLQSSEGFHQEGTRPEAMVVVEGDSAVREGEEGCEREKAGDGKEADVLQEDSGLKGGSATEERMAAHVQFCTSGMYCTCSGGGGGGGGGGGVGWGGDNAGCLSLRLHTRPLSEKSYPLSIRSLVVSLCPYLHLHFLCIQCRL